MDFRGMWRLCGVLRRKLDGQVERAAAWARSAWRRAAGLIEEPLLHGRRARSGKSWLREGRWLRYSGNYEAEYREVRGKEMEGKLSSGVRAVFDEWI